MTKDDRKELASALASAFPSQSALKQALYYELETNLEEVAANGPLSAVILSLIQWAEAHGKLQQLIDGMRVANPGNPALRQFAERFNGGSASGGGVPPAGTPAGSASSGGATSGRAPGGGERVSLSTADRELLIEALQEIPAVSSYEGRSALLSGLTAAHTLNRSQTNAAVDLQGLVDQLSAMRRIGAGELPLRVLVKNARLLSRGTATDVALGELIDRIDPSGRRA